MCYNLMSLYNSSNESDEYGKSSNDCDEDKGQVGGGLDAVHIVGVFVPIVVIVVISAAPCIQLHENEKKHVYGSAERICI